MHHPCARASQGVDVVVGTPGRLLDHLGQGTLSLARVGYIVLDEADRMLDMGFAEDVARIVEGVPAFAARAAAVAGGRAPAAGGVQMMLFSATLPRWVASVASKYMVAPVTVDLVSDGSQAASLDVAHRALLCPAAARCVTLRDVIHVHGGGARGRVIVFTETKREADEVWGCARGCFCVQFRARSLLSFHGTNARLSRATRAGGGGAIYYCSPPPRASPL